MSDAVRQEALGASSRQYRRGALLGMTMAEAFILIAFALLLLLAAWKTRADSELDRYRQIETLTPDQVRDVANIAATGHLQDAARLVRSDNFDALAQIKSSGTDIDRLLEFAADAERWRLIDKDELQRILDGARELPEDLQSDLADLVEFDDPQSIVRLLEVTARAEEEPERYRQIETLTLEEVKAVAELAAAGQIETAARLALSEDFEALSAIEASDANVDRLRQIATEEESWRRIEKDDLQRIVDGARALPDELQGDLAELVEDADPAEITRFMEMKNQAAEDRSLREHLAGIGAHLDRVRSAEAELVEDMRRTLGTLVANVGGSIDEGGALILPDSILFDVGSARLTSRMNAFLEKMCVPWMQVMIRSPLSVSGARIEGHASSEWRADSSVQIAYLNNLDLSQRRSAAVLRECLAIVSNDASDPQIESWARDHLRAVRILVGATRAGRRRRGDPRAEPQGGFQPGT